jgi:predicted  nucleic acid-binding Zn-ribbon protein
MKQIGLNINIGAKIGDAMSGFDKLKSSTFSLGAKVDALGKKRIDILANDENVLKVKNSIEDVGKKLDALKAKRTELDLKLDKTKVAELNNSIGKIDDKIDKLRDKENIIKLQIKAETDEKELKKLNRSLENTRKKTLELSKQKLGLKQKLSDVKEANEKVNKELKETNNNIKSLNGRSLKLKDELKDAENQAKKTNRAVNKIDTSIARINGSKMKIAHIVERREIIRREFHDDLSKIVHTGAALGGVAYGMNRINHETVKMANLADTVSLDFGTVNAFGSAIKSIGLNFENVTDLGEELKNKMGEAKVKYAEFLKEDKAKGKEMKLVGGVDDSFKGLDFSLSDKSFKGLNYEKTFKKFSKMNTNKQFELVFDTALKMKDEQKAASMVDILMGGEANKILSFLRKQGVSYKEFIDQKKKINFLNNEGLKGAKDYAKISAKTSTIVGSMFQQIAGIGGSFMTPILKDSNEYLVVNKEIIQANIKGFFSGVGKTLTKIGTSIDWVTGKLEPMFKLFSSDDTDGIKKIGDDGKELGSTLTYISAGLAGLVGAKMILGTLAMGVGMVSQAIRVATMNPIGLAVAGIATVGYLIYDNWNSISAWWSELWSGFGTTISEKFGWMKTLFDWSPIGLLINNWQSITSFFGGIGEGAKNLFKLGWDGLISVLSWNPVESISIRWNGLMDYFSNFSLKDAGAKIITSVVDGFTSKIEYLKGKVASITQTIRDYWPFSPAKRGALKDIHRIKLLETVAGSLNEKPLLSAVNNTTKKVKKALLMGSATMAISSQLAVASPTSIDTQTQEQLSQANIPNVLNRNFETKENLLTKSLPALNNRSFSSIEDLKLKSISPLKDRTFKTKELLSQANIPKIFNRSFETKENLLTASLPTLGNRSFETLENLKLSNINPVGNKSFNTKESLSLQEDFSSKSLKSESFSKSTPATQTVNISFGETHIHNDMDKESFLVEVEQRVKEALREAERDKANKRMHD